MAKKKTKSQYHKQREQFYQKHPRIKYLLGLLIIAYAIYIGVLFQNIKDTQYAMFQLMEEGIDPSFAEL